MGSLVFRNVQHLWACILYYLFLLFDSSLWLIQWFLGPVAAKPTPDHHTCTAVLHSGCEVHLLKRFKHRNRRVFCLFYYFFMRNRWLSHQKHAAVTDSKEARRCSANLSSFGSGGSLSLSWVMYRSKSVPAVQLYPDVTATVVPPLGVWRMQLSVLASRAANLQPRPRILKESICDFCPGSLVRPPEHPEPWSSHLGPSSVSLISCKSHASLRGASAQTWVALTFVLLKDF